MFIKIVNLPQMKVISFHSWGEFIGDPESKTHQKIDEWSRKRGISIDPSKHQIFGFNNPVPQVNEKGEQYASKEKPYGYEIWITLPKDYQMEENQDVKMITTGLYAVISVKGVKNIGLGWKSLFDWISNNKKYNFHPKWKGLPKYNENIEYGVTGLENHTNYPEIQEEKILLDLYAPIIEKK